MDKLKTFDLYWHALFKDVPLELPGVTTTFGHGCLTSRNYYWDGSTRDYEEPWVSIQYGLKGFGALDRNGKYTRIMPGQVMIVTIPDKHIYMIPKDSPFWEFYGIAMHGPTVVKLAKDIIEHFGSVLTLRPDGKFVQTMNEMKWRFEHGFKSAFENADYTVRLMLAIAEEMSENISTGSRPPFLDKIFTMAITNPILKYEQIKQTTPYSAEYFNRIFKKYTGITPHQWLKEQQLNHVRHLLRFSMLTVKEIADQCGFHDSAHLCRDIRNHLHTTPAHIRNSGNDD